jgi:hypothetical protein
MREKVNFPFKTTKISNLTMKEAMTLLIEVAASSADLIQRWDHSVLKGDVNIGGIASILGHQMLILGRNQPGIKSSQMAAIQPIIEVMIMCE